MLRLLDHTIGSVVLDLDVDAQLFREVEATGRGETLRVWEAPAPAVVLGHGDRAERAVRLRACAADAAPVVRRLTGGGAVVIGPGCLNFSLAVSIDRRPELQDVARSYAVILGALVRALDVPGLARRGLADLALGHLKVSGHAQRRGRRALLHQGTLLYAFDLALMARYLQEPLRQPAYRDGRRHGDFVANLPLDRTSVLKGLCAAFAAQHAEQGPADKGLRRQGPAPFVTTGDTVWSARHTEVTDCHGRGRPLSVARTMKRWGAGPM
jgi:lipoate---protein ligase